MKPFNALEFPFTYPMVRKEMKNILKRSVRFAADRIDD